MEFSEAFRATNGSVPSPSGNLIASVVPPKLVIRSAVTLRTELTVNLSPRFASKISFLRWSPLPLSNNISLACGLMWKRRSGIDNSEEEGRSVQRLLLADDENVQIYDVNDEKWTASISAGFGGIKNVEFGRNHDEVVVFSEFQLKLTIWNLANPKQCVEIPHPKFSTQGFGYRPFTSHFAVLTRSATQDVVSIHQNTTYKLSASFTLPTLDAQGLKWSPCGRWLAVWDSATAGYKVLVYTADGHLYRTHEKPCENLGVKSVEWSPLGDFLSIGSYDGRLSFLSNYTFSPVISMNHTTTVRLPGLTVWSESMSRHGERCYERMSQPAQLPTTGNPPDQQPIVGISNIAFSNPDGTLVATKSDSTPSTVWIWSLKLLRPYAVLIHRDPIKSLNWHPSIPDLLMIQCTADVAMGGSVGPVIYLWSAIWNSPRAIHIPLKKAAGTVWAKWVMTSAPSCNTTSSSASHGSERSHSPEKDDKRPMFLYGNREVYLVSYVEDDPVLEENGELRIINGGSVADDVGWDASDWNFYSPSRDIPTRSHSSPSHQAASRAQAAINNLSPDGAANDARFPPRRKDHDDYEIQRTGIATIS